MSELDKKAFWAYFFQALAGAEAGAEAHDGCAAYGAGDCEERYSDGADDPE